MSIIIAAQEMEMGRWKFAASLSKKLSEILSQKARWVL
jgi:hypothetical protein